MRRIQIKAPALTVLALAAVLTVRAGQSVDDISGLIMRAAEMQQAGDYAGAAEQYRSVLKLRPDDVATHVNLGVVLVRLGRFSDAMTEYQAANKLLPGDPRIALNMALAYEKSGRVKEAAERFEALHSAAPQDDKVTMLLADCHLQMDDDNRVIELLEPLEREHSDDLGLDYMLGMALLHKQRMAEGQVLLDRILRNGDTPQARFLLGTRMFESGDYPSAVKELASAAELDPNLPQLESLYGQALLNTGDPEGAAASFRKELAGNANDYHANLGLAQILTARKQFKEAIPLVRRALDARHDSAAQLTAAQCFSGTGQFGESLPYAEAAVKAMPNSAEAHETLSGVYGALHRVSDATRERRTAQSLASAADPGPKLNEMAPDFELAEVASRKAVRLQDYRGKSPVVLIFGSYSCPNFRASAGALKALQQRYGRLIPFLLVYIREAHSSEEWQSTRNLREKVALAPAATFAEKQEHATTCSRKLHLPFPALVDGMDGTVEREYNAWPSRAFVIGEGGRVLYSTRLTELDFRPEEMGEVLRRAAAHDRASRK